MHKDNIGKTIISEKSLKDKIKELAGIIDHDYRGKEPILVSILKSSVYFTADLTRFLTIDLNIDFLGIGRYPTADNMGKIQVSKDLDISIRDRHVLLIDTIINTGLTHNYLIKTLKPRNPASLKICTLIENTEKRLVSLPIHYRGFTFSETNFFVVGYGLDYQENYRHLPYIAKCHRD